MIYVILLCLSAFCAYSAESEADLSQISRTAQRVQKITDQHQSCFHIGQRLKNIADRDLWLTAQDIADCRDTSQRLKEIEDEEPSCPEDEPSNTAVTPDQQEDTTKQSEQ